MPTLLRKDTTVSGMYVDACMQGVRERERGEREREENVAVTSVSKTRLN